MTNFPLLLILAVLFGSLPIAYGQNPALSGKQKLFTAARALLMKEIDLLLSEVKACSPPKFQSDIEAKFGEAKGGLDVHEKDVVAAVKKAQDAARIGGAACEDSVSAAKAELAEAKKLYDANIALAFESEGQLRTVLKLRTNVALKFIMSSTIEQQKACTAAEKVVDVMKEKNTALTANFIELSAAIESISCATVARAPATDTYEEDGQDDSAYLPGASAL